MSTDGQWQPQQPEGWGQPPAAPPPYGQPPYGQAPYGQPPHGQAPYGQAPYGQPPSGQAPYGQPPHGHVPYGQPPYGQPPYGAPGWPQPASWPQQSQSWPHGPGRPGPATAAAVLGIVTGSLTALGGLAFLIGCLTGDGDLPSWLLALGLPTGAVLLTGGIRLLRRRSVELVLWSAVAAAVVVVLAVLGGAATLDDDDVVGLLGFALVALPLPVVTAALTARRTVRGWADAGRSGDVPSGAGTVG